jgi:hypothetical protein
MNLFLIFCRNACCIAMSFDWVDEGCICQLLWLSVPASKVYFLLKNRAGQPEHLWHVTNIYTPYCRCFFAGRNRVLKDACGYIFLTIKKST